MSEERNDFLGRLVARARGEATVLAPRLPRRWERQKRTGLAEQTPPEPHGLSESPAPPIGSPTSPSQVEATAVTPPATDGVGLARVQVGAERGTAPDQPGWEESTLEIRRDGRGRPENLRLRSDGPPLRVRNEAPAPSSDLISDHPPIREEQAPVQQEAGPDSGSRPPSRSPTLKDRRAAQPTRQAEDLLLPLFPAPSQWRFGTEDALPLHSGDRRETEALPGLERHLPHLEVPLPETNASPVSEVEKAAELEARRIVAAEPSLAGDPVVHVHIGRVEVKPAEPPLSQPPAMSSQNKTTPSLDDYLDQRARRWR